MTDTRMKNELKDMLNILTEIIDEKGQELADSYFQLFQQLQDAGFTEEQAMDLLKSGEALSVNQE